MTVLRVTSCHLQLKGVKTREAGMLLVVNPYILRINSRLEFFVLVRASIVMVALQNQDTRMPRAYHLALEEFVAEFLTSGKNPSAAVAIAIAVTKFPKCPAIEAAFAFTSVASALEKPLFQYTADDEALAKNMYRAIAVFAADIYGAEKLTGPSARCSDVYSFWLASEDRFFVDRLQSES